MSLGKSIKNARKAKGLTQPELGKLLGGSASSISEWETGKHKPDIDTIEKLAGFLDQNPSYFFIEHNITNESNITIIQLTNFLKKLNPMGLEKAESYIMDLLDNPKYTLTEERRPGIPSIDEAMRLQKGTPLRTDQLGKDNVIHKAAFGGGVWDEKPED